ncbi:MAG: ATP-binding protein [Chloroflexota bacterium]
MQVNTTNTHDRQLRDLLHIIAVTTDFETCVSLVLQTALQITGASGAAFRSLNAPLITVRAGDLSTLNLDAMPVGTPEFTALDSVPGALVCAVASGETLLGVLWLVTETLTETAREELALILDALAIGTTCAVSRADADKAQQLAHSLLDSLADPLLVFDTSGRLLLMNPAAGTIFNAQSGQTLDQALQSDELSAFVLGEQPLNEWISGEKTFTPHVQPLGAESAEGWILALRDMTQFRKLNRSQSEFIRIVSHDVRSPLTSMRGFADMMGMVGELNDKQKQFIEKVLSGITQITSLVDNIQDAGRFDPETGFYEMTRSQADLREMVNRVVDNQLIPKDKSDLTIAVSVPDDVPIINADANMIERAVTNLVDNAVKYTPNGGTIDVNVYTAAENLIVSVRDNGYGISADDQQHLFKRHMRLVRPEHKRVKGSGLGLFIVKSVAQRHGGDAWVESEVGAGTTFSFSIPLKGANLIISGGE